MSKTFKIVLVAAVSLLAFVSGVKYAEQVKSHASWMFESKDDEVALPDLSNEEIDGASGEQDVVSGSKAASTSDASDDSAAMDSVSK